MINHESNSNSKNSIQAKIEYPTTNALDRECKWVIIELQAEDSFGTLELWEFQGLVVAIGFIDAEKQKIIGSGVMIAPGLCLTATHVMDEMRLRNALIYSFPCKDSVRIWTPQDFLAEQKVAVEIMPFQKATPRYMDVGILSVSPLSKFNDDEDYVFCPLEVSIPKIGERLWATGYREIENDGVPTLSLFCTSGLVTEQYLEGRGSYINGPCIEVAMATLGGMSGGPVFNEDGKLVGVISSSLEGPKGPTYISLIWPTLTSTVDAPWPENLWPEEVAGIQIKIDKGVKILGSARIDDKGAYKVKFPEHDTDDMLSIFTSVGIDMPSDECDLEEFAYEYFSEFLEEEGIKYLSKVPKEIFDRALIETDYTEFNKLFHCIDTEIMEGIEDLNIKSVKLLEGGNIGIDAQYNLRRTFIQLKISRAEFEIWKEQIISLGILHNEEIEEEHVCYDYYSRPYFRVNFSFNIHSKECQNIRFQALTFKI